MQLIATARFQAAMNRAIAAKPYTDKLAELVTGLARGAEHIDHPLMKQHEDVKHSALVAITSNRGLCGGYNANVLRTAVTHLEAQTSEGVTTDVHMVGRKGIAYFRFLKRPVTEQSTHIDDKPQFADVEVIANRLMDRFVKGEIASAYVVYMRFYSAGKQRPVVLPLLPLTQEEPGDRETHSAASPVEFEYSPEPKALLDELLPATVRVRLFQCFIDAAVSEQIGRMVAMKAATDAADDMITSLTRRYNRARQTQITMELLDIIGGANALA